MDPDGCRNRPSFEDDETNGRFRITWQIVLENKMYSAPVNSGISTGK